MELESYFDFMPEGAIRIKGHRIGVEHVVEQYNKGLSPGEIAEYFGSLALDKVYATILYYLINKDEVDQYIRRINEAFEAFYQEQQRNPSPFAVELNERITKLRQQKLLQDSPAQVESTNETTLSTR